MAAESGTIVEHWLVPFLHITRGQVRSSPEHSSMLPAREACRCLNVLLEGGEMLHRLRAVHVARSVESHSHARLLPEASQGGRAGGLGLTHTTHGV